MLARICAGPPFVGCNITPTPSLFAEPSRPRAIIALFFLYFSLAVDDSQMLRCAKVRFRCPTFSATSNAPLNAKASFLRTDAPCFPQLLYVSSFLLLRSCDMSSSRSILCKRLATPIIQLVQSIKEHPITRVYMRIASGQMTDRRYSVNEPQSLDTMKI